MSTAVQVLEAQTEPLHTYPPTGPSTAFPSPAESTESLKLQRIDNGHDNQRQPVAHLSLTEQSDTNLPPVDKGRDAWLFVAAAFFLETFVWGYSFCFGIVQLYLSQHPNFREDSLASIGSVGTLQMGFQYVLPMFITPYWKRYPEHARYCLWISLVVSPGAMLASSWCTKIYQLIILQGVIGGIANAFLYAPVLVWLAEWFILKRGLASGIIFSGAGLGGMSLPYLISALLNNLGYEWAFRIWAAITFVIFGVSVYFIKPRQPAVKPAVRERWLPRDKTIFWNPRVIMMCIITFVSSLSFFPVSLYLPQYTESIASALSVETVLAVFNGATVLSQVAVGWASDRVDSAYILAALGTASGLTALAAWGLADTLAKTFAFGLVFGSFAGLCSVWSAVARDVAGHDAFKATLLICLFEITRGIAAMIGSPIAAGLYVRAQADESGGWGAYGFHSIIVFVGVTAFASALLGLGLKATRKQKLN